MFSFTGMYSAYYIGFPGMYSVFFLFVCLVLLFLYDLFHTVIQSRNKWKFELGSQKVVPLTIDITINRNLNDNFPQTAVLSTFFVT